MLNRQPFLGSRRHLVLAFDLGTTFSGVSYAILDPGKVPEIKTVSRYPGQESGDSKIQTVIHYDIDGKVLAIGADEPLLDDGKGWRRVAPIKLEWFKLLLRPKSAATADGMPQPQLPPSKDIVDVYADFYRYLFERARDYIRQTHASGDLMWSSVQNNINFVLSHPNGWEGAQQAAMRKAAVKAELVLDTPEGRERITFVSEGEASFHYCLSRGLVGEGVKHGNNVMVIDAGGGTVDLSTYTFANATPITVNEIAAPGCIFEGAVIIRQRAVRHLTAKLRNSRFGTEAHIEAIADEFDKTTKKRFRGAGDAYVKFSNFIGDRDPEFGIRNGQIKLSNEELLGFFDPGVQAIIRAIKEQQEAVAPARVSTYFLVGGFAASEYLYSELDIFMKNRGFRLFRPESHANKAVAEGAVSYHIDHFVSSRVAKFTYGTKLYMPYQSWNAEYLARASTLPTLADGKGYIPGHFESILHQGTQVAEVKTYATPVCRHAKPEVNAISSEIVAYNKSKAPYWVDQDPASFSTLCTISGDISRVPKIIQHGSSGAYCRQDYSVVLSFGLTELKAHLSWMEDGTEVRGPASVVYDNDFVANASSG